MEPQPWRGETSRRDVFELLRRLSYTDFSEGAPWCDPGDGPYSGPTTPRGCAKDDGPG